MTRLRSNTKAGVESLAPRADRALRNVRRRSHFVAPIEDAIRSDTISHVSLLAIQSGQEVVWDPQAYRFTSPTSLNSAIARPARGNWLRPA